MLIQKKKIIPGSEITAESDYINRRKFMKTSALIAGAAALKASPLRAFELNDRTAYRPLKTHPNKKYSTNEEQNSWKQITGYNNFYEFGTGKEDPAEYAGSLKPRPWKVKIDGLCDKPGEYDVDDLIKNNQLEERIYRLRCVEAWSMVIPWVGIPLHTIIKRCRPTSKARYVRFETLNDPGQMPGQRRSILDWPYVEGLRMDEALHPLTLLSVGLYGRVLPNQNGAPIRLVVPWKYGFKSIKSIVRISFVEKMPLNTWQALAPNEYGFYANVNPNVDHPRWSQAHERRLGHFFKQETLMFNGYADEVAGMYANLDLKRWF